MSGTAFALLILFYDFPAALCLIPVHREEANG